MLLFLSFDSFLFVGPIPPVIVMIVMWDATLSFICPIETLLDLEKRKGTKNEGYVHIATRRCRVNLVSYSRQEVLQHTAVTVTYHLYNMQYNPSPGMYQV